MKLHMQGKETFFSWSPTHIYLIARRDMDVEIVDLHVHVILVAMNCT